MEGISGSVGYVCNIGRPTLPLLECQALAKVLGVVSHQHMCSVRVSQTRLWGNLPKKNRYLFALA